MICKSLFRIFILNLIVIFFLSCENNVKFKATNNKDSLSIYIKNLQNNNLTNNETLKFVGKINELAEESKNDSLKALAYQELAISYYYLDKDELFRENIERSISLLNNLNDSSGIAYSYSFFGKFHLKKNSSDSAYFYYYKAERIYRKLQNEQANTGKTLLNMAIIQKNERDYIGGEATTIQAIKYIPDYGEERTLASAYNNLGIISTRLGNYEKAIEYHKKALKLRKGLKNVEHLEVGSIYNIAQAYVSKKDYLSAIKKYEEALSYKNVLNKRPLTYVNLLENLSYANFLSGNKAGLPENYLHSLKVRDSLESIAGSIESNVHLAEYYSSERDTLQAINYAGKAKIIAEKSKKHGEMLSPLLLLSKLEQGENSRMAALKYISISDSLQKAERAKRNQFARIRFETDVIESKNKKITRQNSWLTGISLTVFIVATLLYLVIKERAKNKELEFNQKQQKSNEEIYNLMISQQTKLDEGRHQEKQRVSQELHDGVLSRLFGTRLSLDSLNSRNDTESIENRNKYLDELKSIEQEIRKISHDLNAEIFDTNLGYTEVITNLIDGQMTLNNIEYEFNNDTAINWDRVPNKVKIHLYRILQESLQNINKHAQATNIKVDFKRVKEKIVVDITDDGVGFDNNKVKKGIGLKNIKARIKELNGKLQFTSKRGSGTNINISIAIG